ncbi:ATP-binding protein [Streptomyces sp. NPDC056488]|uniref:ATP-binding protein n=1 Tax=Streptomyces sp. NPDC056488 TaxID=3345836 RepID=UPI0036A3B98F
MAPEIDSATVGPPPQLVLDAVEESVAHARTFVRQFVAFNSEDIGAEPLDDFLLVVSELVTNAVRYGSEPGDSLRVVLETGPGRARVEVHDTRRRRPHFKPESEERQRGRGLFIVDALAKWDVQDRPFGKIIWAEVTW